MPIARASIQPVRLRTAEVPCAPLGADVTVRGMDLPQLLDFQDARRSLVAPLEGESPDQHDSRRMARLIPLVLSMCVLADDGEPIYSEAEWRIWCAQHVAEGFELFSVATSLSGADPEAQKKT